MSRKEPVLTTCIACGTVFIPKDRRSKYCNAKCRKMDNMKKRQLNLIKVCEFCGKEFQTQNRIKYCSIECKRKYRQEHAKIFTKECIFCGKEYEVTHNYSKYCSDECKKKNKQKQDTVILIKRCKFCDNEYEKTRTGSKYCSDECKHNAGKSWYVNVCFCCGKRISPHKAFCKECWDRELKAKRTYDFKYCDDTKRSC